MLAWAGFLLASSGAESLKPSWGQFYRSPMWTIAGPTVELHVCFRVNVRCQLVEGHVPAHLAGRPSGNPDVG